MENTTQESNGKAVLTSEELADILSQNFKLKIEVSPEYNTGLITLEATVSLILKDLVILTDTTWAILYT